MHKMIEIFGNISGRADHPDRARNNFLVPSIHLVISREGSIIEQRDAEQAELNGLILRYTLQTPRKESWV
jgi:hypothetical protein